MKTPQAATKATTTTRPPLADTLFAGGCTAVFLAIMVTVAGSMTLYFR